MHDAQLCEYWDAPHAHWAITTCHQCCESREGDGKLIARLTLSLVLPGLIAAICFGAEVLNLGLIETLAATGLIIGFAVESPPQLVRSSA
ncbi:hypothetical protein [Bradyrhizobium sp. JR3.5]